MSLPGIALTLAPVATSLLVDFRVSVGDRGKFDVNQGSVAQRFVALVGDGRVKRRAHVRSFALQRSL